jgi:hypothetical protein
MQLSENLKIASNKLKTFSTSKTATSIAFLIAGIASTLWFLIRVVPKPTRATYPCMKAAAPIMSGFVVYLLSITASAFAIRHFHKKVAASKYLAASALLLTALAMLVVANTSVKKEAQAVTLMPMSHFAANEPIGTASGFKPGRVVWVWDKKATNENFKPTNNQNNWWAKQTNPDEVGLMLEKALLRYSDAKSLPEAWDALFKYFNEQHGKGLVGYRAGEKIYIKVNITNSASGTKKTNNFDRMDATPELIYHLLKQLIEEVGVAQSDICVGDPFRTFHDLYWDMCHTAFPDVVYCEGRGGNGRHQTVPTADHAMFFSDGKLKYRIPQEYVDADYFINVPCLKSHNDGGITLGAKNHQGSILQDGAKSVDQYAIDMHYALPTQSKGYGKYRHLVDYLGHKDLGGKTLLTIIDGIWAGRSWEGFVEKWQMAPFNNDYPSSLFVSQDRVAIDAVCYDFLLEEYKTKPSNQKYPYFEGTDDYLFQAADPSYWPKGITYDPEGDGTPLKSMGVYEHWNNPTDMNYSRNLISGKGIEFVKVNLNNDPLTPSNSGLASPKVNKIYIDPFDVKWFGTDKGLSRFDGKNWTLIDKSNYLKNDQINDIAYEKTTNGHEIWVATNGGLSVLNYTIDGVTAATTYTVGGKESGLLCDTVTAVALDKNKNRWIATPRGINVFGPKGWAETTAYIDDNRVKNEWNGLYINAIGNYEKDGSVYMATDRKGVIRMKYSDIDGFTGASALNEWSNLPDTVNSVAIYDTIQWFGANGGAYQHFGPSTKEYWDFSFTEKDGILNRVVKDVEKDVLGNIWIGTEKGLHIITPEGILKYTSGTQSSNIVAYPGMFQATIQWTNGNGFIGTLLNENINDLQADSHGNLWIASDSGVEMMESIRGVSNNEETKRVVFITKMSSGNISPVNGTTYIANQEYKKGTALNGWYCIYNGSDNSVDVSALSANTTYRVAIFDYFGKPGDEVYSTATGINNPANFSTTIVGDDKYLFNQTKAYPLPFNEYLVVDMAKQTSRPINVTISNTEGKVLKKATIHNEGQRIETSDLTKGIYFLSISEGKKVQVLKIIK